MTTQRDLGLELLNLTRHWTTYEDVPVSQKRKCKEIGTALNVAGGMPLMREAYYAAKAENPAASAVQAYWDGIGDWRW